MTVLNGLAELEHVLADLLGLAPLVTRKTAMHLHLARTGELQWLPGGCVQRTQILNTVSLSCENVTLEREESLTDGKPL